jgi:glycosyltransferase involved in cell wall biosynthesis
VRFSHSWKSYLGFDLFDRAVAARLPEGCGFHGFVGQSLHCFQKARRLGYTLLELEAANSHVRNVMRLHALARQQYGFETSWLNPAQAQKTLQEYAMADVIYANSDYTRDSLIAEGIPASRIQRRNLQVHPRFQPAPRVQEEGFRVVYTGSVTVMKGIPLLLEAFSRLRDSRAQLTLVGGWATRAMRQYMETWLQRDPRIRIAPGDPLPHLQRADVCVHPTFEDGFAYAPAEALACGVPVIVTEDTGMKELVKEGENGYIVPTGSWEAILERLEHLQRYPLRGKMAVRS